MYLFI